MPRTTKLLALLAASVAPCAIAGAAPALADEVFKATAQVTVPGAPMEPQRSISNGPPNRNTPPSYEPGTPRANFVAPRGIVRQSREECRICRQRPVASGC